jgi:L-fuculose-phosphate aldolase
MNTLPIRQAVVDLCIDLSQRGHFSGTGGNIALRVDVDHIAVTPSATDYLTMTPEQVCVLSLADLAQIEGEGVPSVETGLHARVLRARPDVQASIHTHQPVASACALLGQDLDVPPGALQRSRGVRVPMVGYAPSGSRWLSSKLARQLRSDTNAYLMRNHGALCCGTSTSAALQAVENLETVSRMHLTRLIDARAEREPAVRVALRRVTDALVG